MKYVVQAVVDEIMRQSPDTQRQLRVLVRGFDNPGIYAGICQRLRECLQAQGNLGRQSSALSKTMRLELRLAQEKYESFLLRAKKHSKLKSSQESLRALERLRTDDCLADNHSLTYYRNLPGVNLLVLMGTEEAADQEGLADCFCIDPQQLEVKLRGEFHRVVLAGGSFRTGLEGQHKKCIDSLFGKLFQQVPVNICHLSNWADRRQLEDIDAFIAAFYESLPEWGLPKRLSELPNATKLLQSSFSLKDEAAFVNRTLFKELNTNKRNDLKERILELGQSAEPFADYEQVANACPDLPLPQNNQQLAQCLLDFVDGKSLQQNKEIICQFDYSALQPVLGLASKKKAAPKAKVDSEDNKVSGYPLKAFMQALLFHWSNLALGDDKSAECSHSDATFTIKSTITIIKAELSEELVADCAGDSLLVNAWQAVAVWLGGLEELFNGCHWDGNNKRYSVRMEPKALFSPEAELSSFVKRELNPAKKQRQNSRVTFAITSILVSSQPGAVKKPLVQQRFEWSFGANEAWLQSFSSILGEWNKRCQELLAGNSEPATTTFLPLPLIEEQKLQALANCKICSEFDELMSSCVFDYSFDVLQWMRQRLSPANAFYEQFLRDFELLGQSFADFCRQLLSMGFYAQIAAGQKVSALQQLVASYIQLGKKITEEARLRDNSLERPQWLWDCFVNVFLIEPDREHTKCATSLCQSTPASCVLVPPYHPASLEKLAAQVKYFLQCCEQWWQDSFCAQSPRSVSLGKISTYLERFESLCALHDSLDIMPGSGNNNCYFGAKKTFGNYVLCYGDELRRPQRFKDVLEKDAVFNDGFVDSGLKTLNADSRMLYEVLESYATAFPHLAADLNVLVIDPEELQPVVAAVYNYICRHKPAAAEYKHSTEQLHFTLSVVLGPKNWGGRNLLSYWANTFFSSEEAVSLKIYYREWTDQESELKQCLRSFDIVMMMDVLRTEFVRFAAGRERGRTMSDCCFPLVAKPINVHPEHLERWLEISQPQFPAAWYHSLVVYQQTVWDTTKECQNLTVVNCQKIEHSRQELIANLHKQANWVVCVDRGLDGAILRSSRSSMQDNYEIIAFSTGQGNNGQYNLTVSANNEVLTAIRAGLVGRLLTVFHTWDQYLAFKAAGNLIKKAYYLDGASLLRAVSQEDNHIHEFFAYVLYWAYLEQNKKADAQGNEASNNGALQVVINLDSYKHWFAGESGGLEQNKSRPDFLLLEINLPTEARAGDSDCAYNCSRSQSHQISHNTQGSEGTRNRVHIEATIVECKLSSQLDCQALTERALEQVQHGLRLLPELFSPDSNSVRRRYWYAQLYRALHFAQVTFFEKNCNDSLSQALPGILEGDFTISWHGTIMGYWLNSAETEVTVTPHLNHSEVTLVSLPQMVVQRLLIGDDSIPLTFASQPNDESEKQPEQHKQHKQQDEQHKQLERLYEPLEESRETKQFAWVEEQSPVYGSVPKTALPSVPQNKPSLGTARQCSSNKTEVSRESSSGTLASSGVSIKSLIQTVSAARAVAQSLPLDEHQDERNQACAGINKNESPELSLADKPQETSSQVRVLLGKAIAPGGWLGQEIYWEFDHHELANRHLLITGQSGMGKTYCIQAMLKELVCRGMSCVIFDYTEGFSLAHLEEGFKACLGSKLYEHSVFQNGAPINPFLKHSIEVDGQMLNESDSLVAQRIAGIIQHVFKFGDQQYGELYQACVNALKQNPEEMTLQDLRKGLEEQALSTSTSRTVLSKMQPFFDQANFSAKTDFGWQDIVSGSGQVTVMQLSHLSDEIKNVYTELMLWDAWYYSKINGRKECPFVVVLDEAQRLSHNKTSPCAAILTEGRKFGWSAWFATQSLNVLDADEITRLEQAAVRLYFKPANSEMKKIVKQLELLDPDKNQDWSKLVPQLKKGQCIVAGDRCNYKGELTSMPPIRVSVSPFEERQSIELKQTQK